MADTQNQQKEVAMGYIIAFLAGVASTVAAAFQFKWWKDSTEKDNLLAAQHGTRFEEKIRLEPVEKSKS